MDRISPKLAFSCTAATILLSLLRTGFAEEPLKMPVWPVGGSVYSAAPQPMAKTAETVATNADDLETQIAEPSEVTAPQAPNQLVDGAVVHAAHREMVPAHTKLDDPRQATTPDRSIGSSLKANVSTSAARALPKFGLPAGAAYTTITALAIVVGLFLLTVWLLRRGGRGPTRILPTEAVRVVGRVQLSPRQNAELLKVGNKLVLIALTPTGAEPLTEVTDPAEVNHLLGLCQQFDTHSTTKAFEDVFRNLSRDPAPENPFGQESLLATPTPIADAYRAHRREVGHA